MCPTEAAASSAVTLADVDEHMMERLLEVALADAAADEVTPALGSTPGWNPARAAWFRSYHRAAATGLGGPAHEKTWAVLVGGEVAGSVRLKATEAPDVVETGIWLGRRFRGQGYGRLALELVAAKARAHGFAILRASTTAANAPARLLLAALGAELIHDGETVTARLSLR